MKSDSRDASTIPFVLKRPELDSDRLFQDGNSPAYPLSGIS